MERVTLIAFLFAAVSCVCGCVSIDGGAVEASWVLFTWDGDGRAISNCDCACPVVAKVRLQLIPLAGGGSDPCAGKASCEFSCNRQSGATRFDIPPGSYAISLVPVGVDGTELSGVAAGTCGAGPGVSPIEREVVKGRVTQLDAMVLSAHCAAECGGSDVTKVCTK